MTSWVTARVSRSARITVARITVRSSPTPNVHRGERRYHVKTDDFDLLMKDDVEFNHLQFNLLLNFSTSIAAAPRSMAWFCGRLLAGILGSNTVGGMDVCCECCVLSGRGLCVGKIFHAEESYRV